jgi:hypothetical protein
LNYNDDLIFLSETKGKMNLMNFGREQLESGGLNDLLKQVGINDVGSYVNQFRSKVDQEASSSGNKTADQQPDLVSMGSSLLNQVELNQK